MSDLVGVFDTCDLFILEHALKQPAGKVIAGKLRNIVNEERQVDSLRDCVPMVGDRIFGVDIEHTWNGRYGIYAAAFRVLGQFYGLPRGGRAHMAQDHELSPDSLTHSFHRGFALFSRQQHTFARAAAYIKAFHAKAMVPQRKLFQLFRIQFTVCIITGVQRHEYTMEFTGIIFYHCCWLLSKI